jgi:hypothetical protein
MPKTLFLAKKVGKSMGGSKVLLGEVQKNPKEVSLYNLKESSTYSVKILFLELL